MVGELSWGKISIGIFSTDSTEKSSKLSVMITVVMGLRKAAVTSDIKD